MTMQLINDHRIDVPADMTADTGNTGFPGAYDCIRYKGAEITTIDTEEGEGEAYPGIFVVMFPSGDIGEADSIDEARRLIDANTDPTPTTNAGDFRVDCVEDVGVRNVPLSECFPDDPEAIALAVADIESTGQHRCGGGAAPIFTLVKSRADISVSRQHP